MARLDSAVKRQNDKIVALRPNKAPVRLAIGDSNTQALTPSEAFCLEVDQKDWSMGIQGSSAVSRKFQAISEQGIRFKLDLICCCYILVS